MPEESHSLRGESDAADQAGVPSSDGIESDDDQFLQSLRARAGKAAGKTVGPFVGTVVDTAGKPVAGAKVWLVSGNSLGDSHIVTETTADQQGRFRIAKTKWESSDEGPPYIRCWLHAILNAGSADISNIAAPI